MTIQQTPVGQPLPRLDGPLKVTGTATYAYEYPATNPAYLFPLQASIPRGRITNLDTSAAEALDGVIAILSTRTAPELVDTDDREMAILIDDEVHFRGQLIGGVIAQTAEIAREAAGLVRVEYAEEPFQTELDPDSDDLYQPESLIDQQPSDSDDGDLDAALSDAEVLIDQTYTTPMEHNNPMEPHATVALWHENPDDRIKLTLYDSTQGVHWVAQAIAPLFGLDPEQVRVVAPYVGGGFGSKGTPHAHNTLAALAARLVPGRTVKLALTRQAMFTLTGQRTPTVQRLRLAADKDGTLRGIGHDAIEHTSRVKDFIEQTAELSRMMYAAENRRTSHRVASLDVPVPTYMRAPGEAPGSFGLEVAMDELAVACGIDPIELRRRNEPERDPGLDKPWADRRVIECLTEGAARFGWQQRDPRPGVRRDGEWLEGTGVAVATYPHMAFPGSAAEIDFDESGYQVRIGAVDIESICIGEADPRASAMGARGAGELGTVGVAAAIANATYHATGKRVRDLPLAPERFLTPVAG